MTVVDRASKAADARRHALANLWWAAAAAAILIAAHLLPPDPRGYGTHRHILPLPCIFRELTGLPCPGCGLTTSFALAARGLWAESFAAHYLGPAGYVATWLVLIWGLLGTFRCVKGPAGYVDRPSVLYVLAAVVIGVWIVRLAVIFGALPVR